MPANAQISSNPTLDARAFNMQPYFDQEGSYGAGSRWTVDTLKLQLGPLPSVALVRIPMIAQEDETAPAVSGLSDNPVFGLRIGGHCKIMGNVSSSVSVMTFQGRIVAINEDIARDQCVVEVWDDRWVLAGMPVVGSFWASGDDMGEIVYRQGHTAHFNPKGQANAIYVSVGEGEDGGYVPVFCPSNWGIPPGEQPANSGDSGAGASRAMYWSPAMVLQYLRFVFAQTTFDTYVADAFGAGNAPRYAGWYPVLPENIEWPITLSAALVNENGQQINRKCQEINLDGVNLIDALDRICKMAGPFTIYMGSTVNTEPSGEQDYINQLQIVRTRFVEEGTIIYRPSDGLAQDVLSQQKVFTQGTLGVSGHNVYTRTAIAGDIIHIERRVDSEPTEVDDVDTYPNGLKPAWTIAEQNSWLALYRTRRVAGDDAATAAAKCNRQFINPFSAYRIASDFDFQEGTNYSDFPRCETLRAPLATLLTSYLQDFDPTAGTVVVTQEEKSRFLREVLVERKIGSTWELANWSDGFRIDKDSGTIFFNGLRELGQTYLVTEVGNPYTVTVRPLRMTLAIPTDTRFTSAYRIAGDPSSTELLPGETFTDDADKIDPSLRRLYYADAERQMQQDWRQESWPVPETVPGSTQKTGFIHDDVIEIDVHAEAKLRDMARLSRSKVLTTPYLKLAWTPGIAIDAMQNTSQGDYPIRNVVHSVTWNVPANTTMLELT